MKRFKVIEIKDNYKSAHYIDCECICEQISPFCVKIDNNIIVTFMNEVVEVSDCSDEIKPKTISKVDILRKRLLKKQSIEEEMFKDLTTKEIMQLSKMLAYGCDSHKIAIESSVLFKKI